MKDFSTITDKGTLHSQRTTICQWRFSAECQKFRFSVMLFFFLCLWAELNISPQPIWHCSAASNFLWLINKKVLYNVQIGGLFVPKAFEQYPSGSKWMVIQKAYKTKKGKYDTYQYKYKDCLPEDPKKPSLSHNNFWSITKDSDENVCYLEISRADLSPLS